MSSQNEGESGLAYLWCLSRGHRLYSIPWPALGKNVPDFKKWVHYYHVSHEHESRACQELWFHQSSLEELSRSEPHSWVPVVITFTLVPVFPIELVDIFLFFLHIFFLPSFFLSLCVYKCMHVYDVCSITYVEVRGQCWVSFFVCFAFVTMFLSLQHMLG